MLGEDGVHTGSRGNAGKEELHPLGQVQAGLQENTGEHKGPRRVIHFPRDQGSRRGIHFPGIRGPGERYSSLGIRGPGEGYISQGSGPERSKSEQGLMFFLGSKLWGFRGEEGVTFSKG